MVLILGKPTHPEVVAIKENKRDKEMFKSFIALVIRRIFDSLTETSEFSSAGEVTAKLRQAEMLKYSVVVIAALPFCLLYPFVQKYFNKGVMIGAVKG